MTKSGDTIVFTAYLNVLKEVPAGTTIITIDPKYALTNHIVHDIMINVSDVRALNLYSNGTMQPNGLPISNLTVVWQI